MEVESQISRYNTLAVDFSYLGLRQSRRSQLGHLPKMVLPTLPQESTTSKAAPAGEHQEMRLGKRRLSNPTPPQITLPVSRDLRLGPTILLKNPTTNSCLWYCATGAQNDAGSALN